MFSSFCTFPLVHDSCFRHPGPPLLRLRRLRHLAAVGGRPRLRHREAHLLFRVRPGEGDGGGNHLLNVPVSFASAGSQSVLGVQAGGVSGHPFSLNWSHVTMSQRLVLCNNPKMHSRTRTNVLLMGMRSVTRKKGTFSGKLFRFHSVY